jgi:Spy/CpxP family protein refolding chaperone
MKYKTSQLLLACGAILIVYPALHAQNALPAPTISGANSARPGPSATAKTGNNVITDTPCWECHRWLEPHRLEKLTTDLSLTANQQTQLKPILEKARTLDHTAKQDGSLSQQQKAARFKDAWNTANTQIASLLTPAQQEKFALVKDQYSNRRPGASQPSPTPAATP